MKNIYEKVSVKKLKDYPFEDRVKKPYFVEIDDGNDIFIKGFDKKNKAVSYARTLNSKSKRIYLN